MLTDPFEPTSFATVDMQERPSPFVDGQWSTACGAEIPAFSEPSAPSEGDLSDLKRKYSGSLIVFDRLRSKLLDPEVLERHDEDGWTVREIFGHLIDSDRDIWWPRIEAMLQSDHPFLPSIDQERLMDDNGWKDRTLEAILAEFMKFRWSAALRINDLSSSDLLRQGSHYQFGDISVANVVQILVAHDAHFLAKLHALLEGRR